MKPRVFRSTPSLVFGWVWVAFAAANLIDLAVRGRDVAAVIAAGALLLGAGVAYVVGLRPRVVADDDGVRLCNPLHDIRVPWSAVDKIETADAIKIHSGGQAFRAWALQTSPRARARAEGKARRGKDSSLPEPVAKYVQGRLPVDFAADQLTELATQRRRDSGQGVPSGSPSVSLSWLAMGALIAPAALLASSILAAVLS